MKHLAVASALLVPTASGCAMLYDFEGDDGKGGAATTASGGTASGGERGVTASTTTDASAQTSTTDQSSSSWLGVPPAPDHATIIGSVGKDEGLALVLTNDGTPAIAVRLGAPAMIGDDDILFANQAAIVTVHLDSGLDVDWAKLEADVDDFGAADARPARLLALASGDIITYGAMSGLFMAPTPDPALLDPGVWMVRRSSTGAPNRTFVANGEMGDDLLVGGAIARDDGGVRLGISSSGPITIAGGMPIPFNFPSGSILLPLDANFAAGGHEPLDVFGGDTVVDLQRAADGVTASLVNLEADMEPRVTHVPIAGGAHPNTTVLGRAFLARGKGDKQMFCASDPQDTGMEAAALTIGKITIGATLLVENVRSFPESARCNDIATMTNDVVVAGTYLGAGPAGLPVSVDRDGFVIRVTQAGDVVWALRVGGEGDQTIASLAVSDAHVVVTGTSTEDLEFGGVLHPVAGGDAYVARWTIDP